MATQQTGSGKPESRPGLPPEQIKSTQSDASLSKNEQDEEDERFSVAEEVNFDQQSDRVRRAGEMPADLGSPAADPDDAMAEALKPEPPDEKKSD